MPKCLAKTKNPTGAPSRVSVTHAVRHAWISLAEYAATTAARPQADQQISANGNGSESARGCQSGARDAQFVQERKNGGRAWESNPPEIAGNLYRI
jgi:hypothetical protein